MPGDLAMTREGRRVSVGCVFGLLCFAGCGTTSSPPAVSTPTVLQIAGRWAGTASDSSGPGTMAWTLTQNSTNVSGSVEIATPLRTVVMTGTIAGTLSGSALAWRLDIPAGGVSGQPTCAVTVTGTSTIAVNGLTMDGSYSGTGSCTPAFTNGAVSLTKQS